MRVLGEVKKEYCDLPRRATPFIEERKSGSVRQSQSGVYRLPAGPPSCWRHGAMVVSMTAVLLRAVETIDLVDRALGTLPYDFLGRVSNRIINEVNGISVWCMTSAVKPPATIEWE